MDLSQVLDSVVRVQMLVDLDADRRVEALAGQALDQVGGRRIDDGGITDTASGEHLARLGQRSASHVSADDRPNVRGQHQACVAASATDLEHAVISAHDFRQHAHQGRRRARSAVLWLAAIEHPVAADVGVGVRIQRSASCRISTAQAGRVFELQALPGFHCIDSSPARCAQAAILRRGLPYPYPHPIG